MNASASVTRKSGVGLLAARLEKLKKAEVFVGIPQDKSLRTVGEITNAQLLYILTNGSALQNIPATPIIEPAIARPENKAPIVAELNQAAHALLAGDAELAHEHLVKAGTLGANAAKREFTNPANGWPPNAPATIERKGSNRRNIDTGELRRDITYVVKDQE
jgi:hypothetical protein